MSENDNVAQKSAESDKQSEVKKPADKPQVDVLDLMEGSAEHAKLVAQELADPDKRWTIGDGGFGIDYPEVQAANQFQPDEAPQTATVEKVGNKVTKVTYPTGRELEFEYDAEGNVSKITDPKDGDRWEKKDDSWRHVDKAGNDIPAQPGDLNDPKNIDYIRVNDEGGIVTIRKDRSHVRENPDFSVDTYVKGRTIFDRADGSSEEVHENGISVTRSTDGTIQVEPNTSGPDGNKWEEHVPHKDHPAYRDDPSGTRYYQNPNGQTLSVYPDGSYKHQFKGEDGRGHEVTYDPKSGDIKDTWIETSEVAPPEKISRTRDRAGNETTARAVWNETDRRYEQVDPPPTLPNPAR